MSQNLSELLLSIDKYFFTNHSLDRKLFAEQSQVSCEQLDYALSVYQQQREKKGQPLLDIHNSGGDGDVKLTDVTMTDKPHRQFETIVEPSSRAQLLISQVQSAIDTKTPISMIYTSVTSGSMAREFVPHVIVDNGIRLHVRGFDRHSQQFRDFVISRISQIKTIDSSIFNYESLNNDTQWNRILKLKLRLHPTNTKQSTAIEMEYDMVDGEKELHVRAALVGYLLRNWNVDCSEDATLRGDEYQLWLSNRDTIFDTENLILAPGFISEIK